MNPTLEAWAQSKKSRYSKGVSIAFTWAPLPIGLWLLLKLVYSSGSSKPIFAALLALLALYLFLTSIGWIRTWHSRLQENERRRRGEAPSYAAHLTVNAAKILGYELPATYQEQNQNAQVRYAALNTLYGGPRGQLIVGNQGLEWSPSIGAQKQGITQEVTIAYGDVAAWKLVSLATATPVACLGFVNQAGELIDFTIFDPRDVRTRLASHIHVAES